MCRRLSFPPWLFSALATLIVLPLAGAADPWRPEASIGGGRIVRRKEEAAHRRQPHFDIRAQTAFELLSIDAAGEAVTIPPDQAPFSSLVDALDMQAPVAQPAQAQPVAAPPAAPAVATAAPVAATAAPGAVAPAPAAASAAQAGTPAEGGTSIFVYLLYLILGVAIIGCIAFFAFAAMRAAKKMESRSQTGGYSAKRRGFGSLSSHESGNGSDGGAPRPASDSADTGALSYRDACGASSTSRYYDMQYRVLQRQSGPEKG